MAGKSNIPRFVIVQDQQVGAESVVRAVATSNSSTEQAGLTVVQPLSTTSTLVGDIRPSLSGEVERESAGTLNISSSGGAGTLRFGFVKNDASPSFDLQLRQRPSVSGREPALLSDSTAWTCCPRLVPMLDGSLLCVWMEQSKSFKDQTISTTTWGTTFYVASLDPTNDTWTTKSVAVDLGAWGSVTEFDAAPSWVSFDVVQYPDTGELVAVIVGSVSVGAPNYPVGAVFSSTDGGATWGLRKHLTFNGADGLLGDGIPAGIANEPSLSVAAELSTEGRIVVLWSTRNVKMVALTSDDRGHNWTAVQIDAINGNYETNDVAPVPGFAYSRLSMRRMRNGVILAVQVVSSKNVVGGQMADTFLWKTVDGITFEAEVSTYMDSESRLGVAVCESPDGYPWFFSTVHAVWAAGFSSYLNFDELQSIPFDRRDVSSGDAVDTLWRDNAKGGSYHWSLIVDEAQGGAARANAPAGDLASLLTDPPLMDGFAELDSVRFRGQIVHAVVMNNEVSTKSSLMALRTNFFQPIQEREGTGVFDTFPASTRAIAGFSRTWACYQDPTQWGYVLTSTGGTSALGVGSPDNGFWSIATAAQQRYFSDNDLPCAAQSHNAVLRTVMRPVSGGNLGADSIAIRMQLHDAALGTSFSLSLQMKATGPDVAFQPVDNRLGGAVGGIVTLSNALGHYIEILISTQRFDPTASTVNCLIYARPHDRANDPDFLSPYTLVYSGPLQCDAIVLDNIDFGHLVSGTADSRWKCVDLWRQQAPFVVVPGQGTVFNVPPLSLKPAGYVDNDGLNVRSDFANPNILNDSGFRNFMRCAQGVSLPAQFFTDGVHAEWRGESLATGAISYGTDFIYAAKHLLDQSSPQREYRSVDDTTEIEIILDATLRGGTGAVFTTRAIAVIGRNFPSMKLQLNDVDSPTAWVAPSVDLRVSVPGAGVYDRATHILDFSGGLTTGSYRVKVTTAAAAAKGGEVFRPHRFRAVENGRTFYAVFVNQPTGPGNVSVIKIIDNTAEVLILETDPISVGISSPTQMSIISDRFAWDFSHAMPPSPTGYRYIRLVLERCTHQGADAFFRAGSIILGQPTEMEPGIAWGYSTTQAPGATIIAGLTGAGFSSRQSAERGQWSFDSPGLLAANESQTNSADDIEQTRASWQKLTDLARRLEQNGEMAALVFDGLRFGGATAESGEQLLTDPYDLALVRLTDGGGTRHQGYSLDTIPSVGIDPTDCVPRPVQALTGITFTEQL